VNIKALFFAFCLLPLTVLSQSNSEEQGNYNTNSFKQLYEELPTPNLYRTASGAPGHGYYQQKADYEIDLNLDDDKQIITGEEKITYHNNSPDRLEYLWLQLDQNMRALDSDTRKISTGSAEDMKNFWMLKRLHSDFDGGFNIEFVTDEKNRDLPFQIVKTMMRVDLPTALLPGEEVSFNVRWWYRINDRAKVGGRSGLEYFPEEDNYLYTIAQFFPRMCVYNDVDGWQNKQFLGRGEFTLPFGDYKVKITAPADHIVGSTGVLQNASECLTSKQRSRLRDAEKADAPVMIVTPDEALEAEKSKATKKKTWVFHAENVRDFAFCSSRKFIWDAMNVKVGDKNVMCMSYFPKEGNPLWERYSTKVVAHTIKTYSKFTIDYIYPVAISVHTNNIGMEYPMICFNGGRPEADGTYSERTKYGMISVIIHEVGHNFFPMIINSDERQWTWMDEGLNTFVQYLTEKEWDRDYPSRRGPAWKIADYMGGDKSRISPIMTNSESIFQFGNNAYGKPATAMNILRETVMGRESFDKAFKMYCERWAFKHPTPADLFRTMEDASGIDLDWYWRGWFFTNKHVDISLDGMKWFRLSDFKDVSAEKAFEEEQAAYGDRHIGVARNKADIKETILEKDPQTVDFYNTWERYKATSQDQKKAQQYRESLDEDELKIIDAGYNYYELTFTNEGGLPMPLILEFTFTDGSKEVQRIPAEIWKSDPKTLRKVFFFEKEVSAVEMDPFLETADVDMDNNSWPPQAKPSRFQIYKQQRRDRPNPMQQQQRMNDQ